ncbi:MAG: NnrS family protein, partial [Gammaproteobacteria bacterium]|nr:NnrS family protein [Gammaproteobacteria bacterium]
GPLAVLFLLWIVARVANHLNMVPPGIGAIADLSFNWLMASVLLVPIIKARQWKQTAIIGKLVLLAVLNMLFYLDVFGLLNHGAWWAVYGAFYTIIALILMMTRRLIPFFVERGVGYPVMLRNSRFLDLASLVLFLELMISELFGVLAGPTLWVAAALFVIHFVRLVYWYTPGIWRRPLLWSLYLSYAMLVVGFLLFALTSLLGIPKLLVLHTFAIGGIGIITVSMMSRVSLGHSGRNIHEPPLLVTAALVLLVFATLTRVAGPLIDAAHYSRWVEVSGGMWILAFVAFSVAYAPILLQPRVDGRYG